MRFLSECVTAVCVPKERVTFKILKEIKMWAKDILFSKA